MVVVPGAVIVVTGSVTVLTVDFSMVLGMVVVGGRPVW